MRLFSLFFDMEIIARPSVYTEQCNKATPPSISSLFVSLQRRPLGAPARLANLDIELHAVTTKDHVGGGEVSKQ
jgi:hypothetical protein